jgi:GNAT superfamily N-acetyltransferase
MAQDDIRVHVAAPDDLPWAEAIVSRHFGSTEVVSRGKLHRVRHLPGLVAEYRRTPAGLLLYRPDDDGIEIVVLIAELERQGIATRLVESLRQHAISTGCRRIWLVTTNDNLDAIAFYRATGWHQAAIHTGAVRVSRRLKPQIPEFGPSGLPIEDEIEFVLEL